MAQNIGPALPPGWNKFNDEDSDKSSDCSGDQDIEPGPSINPNPFNIIGPSLPSNLEKTDYGPQLPPDFSITDKSDTAFYGPKLPPQLDKTNKSEKVIGPALPPGFSLPINENIEEDSTDDECIGPSLTEFHSADKSVDITIAKTFEDRAKKMKDKLLYKEEEVQKREEWMTELPNILGTKIGLGARTFSKKSGPSVSEMDRSGWTETPKDKEKKEQTEELEEVYHKPTLEELATHSRNLKLTNKIDKFNEAKRKESLLDIHKKNLKRKANEDKDKKEKRREFDRDKDLNIQKIDKEGANNIIARSKVFNSKFSHGSNHFL